MKINKLFCLDEEIAKKLEGLNASELVNRLLKEHFSTEMSENLTILKKKYSENKQILKESKRKDRELASFIDKIEQNEKIILNLSKGMNEEQIRMLRGTAEINVSNWTYLRKHFPNYTFAEIRKLKGGL
jgi:hypothetical protein